MDTEKKGQWMYHRKPHGVLKSLWYVVLIITVLFAVVPAVNKYGDSLIPARTLTVSAEGKTFVTPDTAQTSFSVISRGKNPEELAAANNEKVGAVVGFLKSQGVAEKDIRSDYNLSPEYQYDKSMERNYIVGYALTQSVTVKIKKLDAVAKIIGELTPLGVNQIGGVAFTVDNPESFLGDARKDAIQKAKTKAEAMASESGARLGKLVNVAEYQNVPPIPYAYSRANGIGGAEAAPAPPAIQPGTEELTVEITLTYALE